VAREEKNPEWMQLFWVFCCCFVFYKLVVLEKGGRENRKKNYVKTCNFILLFNIISLTVQVLCEAADYC